MDTLATVQRKALDISLSIAKMDKVSEIIPQFDELLEMLTGNKAFIEHPLVKTPKTEPEPEERILTLLENTPHGLTYQRISKETNLDTRPNKSLTHSLRQVRSYPRKSKAGNSTPLQRRKRKTSPLDKYPLRHGLGGLMGGVLATQQHATPPLQSAVLQPTQRIQAITPPCLCGSVSPGLLI